jgi:hypothetical protein
MSGTFILSLDTEIAWGTYGAVGSRAAAFDRFPEILRRLIRQLDIFEVSATWALVGALLLLPDEHPAVPSVQYSFANAPDELRTLNGAAAWYRAGYLLDALHGARVPQEIGTHTMTHLLADDPAVSRADFSAQLAAVRDIHARHNLAPPRSIVYPQNRIAHTDVLREYGIIAYRGKERVLDARLPRPLRRAGAFVRYALATPPPTYDPTVDITGGVVNLPASQFLLAYDGVRRRIPTAARVKQAEHGLAAAAQDSSVYHLWFHPFNLGSDEAMFDALTQILARVWHYRERGLITVTTMGALAASLLDTRDQ